MEKDGMVQVGAAVTQYEALAAGQQILRFCYSAAGRLEPIVLDRPDVESPCRVTCPDGMVEVIDGKTAFVSTSGKVTVLNDPPALAAALVAVHDYAKDGLNPAEVERLTAFLDEAMDASPEDLARRLLTEFDVKAKQGDDGWEHVTGQAASAFSSEAVEAAVDAAAGRAS
ncbi:hypothetical protein ACGFNU_21615 [Spirillospora sp. NPDC048911]|uniref:hypothetical protein n=1 Tax=Spirillospora sp. NPDC048911 TaxID=3364527 RepID=UPI003723B969